MDRQRQLAEELKHNNDHLEGQISSLKKVWVKLLWAMHICTICSFLFAGVSYLPNVRIAALCVVCVHVCACVRARACVCVCMCVCVCVCV